MWDSWNRKAALVVALITAAILGAQASQCRGDEPKVEVDLIAPARADILVGDQVKILATVEGVDSFSWDVYPPVEDYEDVARRDSPKDYLFIAEFTEPGGYRIQLEAIGRREDGSIYLKKYPVFIEVKGTKPNPIDPDDPVVPVDPDDPVVPPAPVKGPLRVLILYESEKLTPSQRSIIWSDTLTRYLETHCEKDADGRIAKRFWDDDSVWPPDDQLSETQKKWKAAYEVLNPKQPDDEATIFIQPPSGPMVQSPLPSSLNDLMTLLKKYGGE